MERNAQWCRPPLASLPSPVARGSAGRSVPVLMKKAKCNHETERSALRRRLLSGDRLLPVRSGGRQAAAPGFCGGLVGVPVPGLRGRVWIHLRKNLS